MRGGACPCARPIRRERQASELPLLKFRTERRQATSLLQFGVFGFGFVQQRKVGIGIFPGGEKILIGDASLRSIVFLLKYSSDSS